MKKILKTTNLCKAFNGQEVVSNISLNIEENSYLRIARTKWCRKIYYIKNGYRHFETNIRKN